MGALFSRPVYSKRNRTASKPPHTSPRNTTVNAVNANDGLSDVTKKILIRQLSRRNGDLEETGLKPIFSDNAKPISYVQMLRQSPTRSARTGFLSNATTKRMQKKKTLVDKIFLSEFGDSPVSKLADSSSESPKPKTYLQSLKTSPARSPRKVGKISEVTRKRLEANPRAAVRRVSPPTYARSPRKESPGKIGKISEVTRKRIEAHQTPREAVRRVSPPTYAKTVKARPESYQQKLRKQRFLRPAPSASNLYRNAPERGLFAEEAEQVSSPHSSSDSS